MLKRLRSTIKTVLYFLLYWTGVERWLSRRLQCDAAAILMYHGVADSGSMPAHINFNLERDIFRQQLAFLNHRYRIVSLPGLLEKLRRGERLDKEIVLTFDDGYQNNADAAAPEMERLGVPYTVFLATRYIGREDYLPLNELYTAWAAGKVHDAELARLRSLVRDNPLVQSEQAIGSIRALISDSDRNRCRDSFAMLNWPSVRQIASRGADIGCHTHDHCNMAIEDKTFRHRQLLLSKELLERECGKPIRLFAYPYGRREHFSPDSRHSLAEAGFEGALTTVRGLVTHDCDLLSLPRISADRRLFYFAGELLLQFWKYSRVARNAPDGVLRHS